MLATGMRIKVMVVAVVVVLFVLIFFLPYPESLESKCNYFAHVMHAFANIIVNNSYIAECKDHVSPAACRPYFRLCWDAAVYSKCARSCGFCACEYFCCCCYCCCFTVFPR